MHTFGNSLRIECLAFYSANYSVRCMEIETSISDDFLTKKN